MNRKSVLLAAGLILIGSAGIQTSSALSSTLFTSYGSAGVSAMRMLVASLILLALFRPSFRGRSRGEWVGIVVYGVAMAMMNLSLYAAIERIPLGIAVTLEFLGPCAVALLASRRIREGLCAGLSLAGVALLSIGPWGYFDLIGYLAGLGAAAAFGIYTVFAARVGKAGTGLDGLSLSVTAAAIVTLPLAIPRVPELDVPDTGVLALSAMVGVVIPYAVDTIAARLTSARVVGTLFAIDPAMGALAGLVFLGEAMTFPAIMGIVIVAASGAMLVWVTGSKPKDEPDPCGESIEQ